MTDELREYIQKEMKYTCHPKYYKYIDEYISNLTEHQIEYWKCWMKGKLTPYTV